MINSHDILETINMIDNENLDIRTVTMGISCWTVLTATAAKPVIRFMIKSADMRESLSKQARTSARNTASRSSISGFL